MNQELQNRVAELLYLALRDIKEAQRGEIIQDDPFIGDAVGSIHEALAIVNGEFSSFDNQF
jgi:hypothetical protein